jgi:ABC-2 type transport system permease protein
VRLLAKMSWLEQKLFVREPLTVLFALALPLVVLFVMGGVFGNESTPEVYRGVGAMDYYIPAYIALVAASVGLISLPTHIASDRERGVLKRYRASGVPVGVVVGSQIVVTFSIAGISSIVLIAVAMPTHEVARPDSIPRVLGGFGVVALSFAAVGVLLGAVLPSARAAQALGVLLWFVLLILGGAGPPPEVLTGAMGVIGDASLLRQAIEVMQDGWLGLDPGRSWLIVAAVAVLAGVLALGLFRWE